MNGNRLGEILKTRRQDRGLTLLDLSEQTGVHQTHLGRIERGERHPSASILRRVAESLDFTEIELLKLGDYLSPDQVDERIARFKKSMKCEIDLAMANLKEKLGGL